MAVSGGFFNSLDNDRLYYAEDVNHFFEGLVGAGVFISVGGALHVTAGTGMQVQVASGRLVDSKGRWLRNDATLNLTIGAADVLLPRYDAIVAGIDSTSAKRSASIYVKSGTAASSPAKPAITRNEYLEEYCLAYVYVDKGVTAITQSAITDTRPDASVCGWVSGLIKQVDTSELFAQYQAAYEEDRQANQSAFNTWFASIKDSLAAATLIRSYNSVYTTSKAGETVIPIGISQYNKEIDILQAYINGLRLVPNSDYTITSNAQITLTKDVDAGTPVSFEVFKSVDGSDAETVVSQVNDIQNDLNKYVYDAAGENDNVLLSQKIQSFLSAGNDYAQLEIDVRGSLDCSTPYSGAGTDADPYIWFALGQGTVTTRRVRLNFAKCNRITVDSSSYPTAVLFGGNDIYMRNCQAVMNNVSTGKIFNGERVVCDDSEFWLNGTGELIGGGCCGTFTNCRMSVTSSGSTAAGFSANGNVLRLIDCEILAYNLTSVSGEANGVVVEAGQTENVLIMSGCSVPIADRNGYKQSNTVKINNGYYCLTGNLLGKEAAKYSTGDGKTETGTMLISK